MKRTASAALLTVATASVIAGCGSNNTAATTTITETEAVMVTVTTTERITTSATPTTTRTTTTTPRRTVGDGIYEVGSDIPAGTYKTNGPRSDIGVCSYTFLPSKGAGLGEAEGGNTLFGPGYMEVTEGQIVQTLGCSWTLDQ